MKIGILGMGVVVTENYLPVLAGIGGMEFFYYNRTPEKWIDATGREKKPLRAQYIRVRFTRNSSKMGSKPRLMSASTRSMRYWPHLSFSSCQWAAMAVR